MILAGGNPEIDVVVAHKPVLHTWREWHLWPPQVTHHDRVEMRPVTIKCVYMYLPDRARPILVPSTTMQAVGRIRRWLDEKEI